MMIDTKTNMTRFLFVHIVGVIFKYQITDI